MKKPSVIKRTLIIVGSILAVGLVAIIFVVTYRGSTEPIEEVAAQLRVDPSWKLESEVVEPPRFICLGGNSCPSIHKVWNTGKYLNKSNLVRLLESSGWNFVIEEECEPSPRVSGSPAPICSASGVEADFKVLVWVLGSYDSGTGKLVISINEK